MSTGASISICTANGQVFNSSRSNDLVFYHNTVDASIAIGINTSSNTLRVSSNVVSWPASLVSSNVTATNASFIGGTVTFSNTVLAFPDTVTTFDTLYAADLVVSTAITAPNATFTKVVAPSASVSAIDSVVGITGSNATFSNVVSGVLTGSNAAFSNVVARHQIEFF